MDRTRQEWLSRRLRAYAPAFATVVAASTAEIIGVSNDMPGPKTRKAFQCFAESSSHFFLDVHLISMTLLSLTAPYIHCEDQKTVDYAMYVEQVTSVSTRSPL